MAEEKKQVPTKVVGMDSVCAKPEKEIKEPAKNGRVPGLGNESRSEANTEGVNSHAVRPLPFPEITLG